MTEENVERILVSWARDYSRQLPEDFSDRLRSSVRRSRRSFRLRLAALVALIAASLMIVIVMAGRTMPQSERETALVAAKGGVKDKTVTGWALLSMFRECFRRGRSGKKKEDEQ